MIAHSPPAEGTKTLRIPPVIQAITGKFDGVAIERRDSVIVSTRPVPVIPIALALHGMPGPELRATLSTYFLVGTTISLVVLGLAGQFGTSDLVIAAWLVLPVAVGVVLSGPLRAPLDRGWLAPAVYVLSSAAAVILLVRSLV